MKTRTFIAVLTCIFTLPLFAQDTIVVQDLETWSSISANYKLNKKWSLSLEEQLRLKSNSSELDQFFTEVGTKYKVAKGFTTGVAARYIRENDNEGKVQGMENHLRFHLDVSYRHKIDRLRLKYRVRGQTKSELGVITSEWENKLRLLLKANYNIKNWKLDPFVSTEIFREVSSSSFEKYRLTLGTSYKFKNKSELGAFYRLEKELKETLPKSTNVIGVSYQLNFKKDKK